MFVTGTSDPKPRHMQPFHTHEGGIAVLEHEHVDTDQIIPKQFLKRIERAGFGQFLFYDWRYNSDGTLNPSFSLNAAAYADASILVTGRNFGCGSSREHAAWALFDYGFRAVIATSFADIFAANCVKNGIVPAILSQHDLHDLLARAKGVANYRLLIDLEQELVRDRCGFVARFAISQFDKHRLLDGVDDIALTLRYAPQITAFETSCYGCLRRRAPPQAPGTLERAIRRTAGSLKRLR